MKKPKPKETLFKRPPETIGFRLDPDSNEVLARRAESMGLSVHELARHYLLEILNQEQERAIVQQAILHLRDEITELTKTVYMLREDICELREDLALAIEVLLARAGKVDKKEARHWVDTQFKPKH